MAETPCQKCKRERDELAARVARLERDRDRWMKRYDDAAGLLRDAGNYMDLDGLEMADRIHAFLGPEPLTLPAVYQPED